MKTITAKDLRDNLDEVVNRVRNGETMRVTYRSKPAFTLQPDRSSGGPLPGSEEAMERFVEGTRKLRISKKQSVFDPNKSIKELYHEMLDNNPKYKPPYHL